MTIAINMAINIAIAHLGIFGEDLYRVVGEVLVVDQRHPPEVFQAPEMLEAVLHDAAVRPVYPRHLQLSVSPHRETVVVPQLDNHPKLEVGSSPIIRTSAPVDQVIPPPHRSTHSAVALSMPTS